MAAAAMSTWAGGFGNAQDNPNATAMLVWVERDGEGIEDSVGDGEGARNSANVSECFALPTLRFSFLAAFILLVRL